MAYEVEFTEDPAQALNLGGRLLAASPVLCNLVASILQVRIDEPRAGRYWIVNRGGEAVGVGLQSPASAAATSTPMPRDAAIALADAITDQGFKPSGFSAVAETSAAFAGQWAERNHVAVRPSWSGRIYEQFPELAAPFTPPSGSLRTATFADQDLLARWVKEFQDEAAESHDDPAVIAAKMILEERAVFWEDEVPLSLAGFRPSPQVARLGPVYTPKALRGQGYGRAVVSALTDRLGTMGMRSMLYTDLANPTSNSVYLKIGYRPVAEVVRFELCSS